MKENNVKFDVIISTARNLYSEGKQGEARELLLKEGYIKKLEEHIQEEFLVLIPISKTLKIELDETYIKLNNSDPKVRFKAANKLLYDFSKEKIRDNIAWMRDPRAIDPLIKMVSDPDLKVSRRALKALSRLVGRYFPDLRTFPIFLEKLKDKNQEVRIDAINAIGCLGHENLLMYLVEMFEKGKDKDRSAIASQIWAWSLEPYGNPYHLPIKWSKSGRKFWIDKMEKALKDPSSSVRIHASRALRCFNEYISLKALKGAREKEKDDIVIQELDYAISTIKEKHKNGN
ncbi:MAG: HEAT repeat domain-containing protein [Candidatus Lokiarchaeota archaeon]|nr:HEAT repeat domain-containing protein [Candidatus Lokiarchaeota archaeon]